MNQPAFRWSLPIVLVAAVLHFALWLLLIRELVFTLPEFGHTFKAYNAALPTVTNLLLTVVRVAEPAPVIWLVFPIVDGMVLIVLHRQRQLAHLLHWSLLLLFLLAIALGGLELERHLAILGLQEGLPPNVPVIYPR